MPNIEGVVGVWTGCGFSTIAVLFPPPDILGYDFCVPPILDTTPPSLGVMDILNAPANDPNIPLVVIDP